MSRAEATKEPQAARAETSVPSRRVYRLAALASHPIQYQVPLFRFLASQPEIDLTVLFCSDWGLNLYHDEGFGQQLKWDVPLLDGYHSEFLPNISPKPNPSTFFGLVNPASVKRLGDGNFDAVWVHGWRLATNWIVWASAAFRHLPILLRTETSGLSEPTGLKGIVKKVVLKNFFSQVAGFLAIGTNNANFYKSYGIPEERIFLTPYSVDNAFFTKRARELDGQKRILRRKESIPINLPLILFCGKLQGVKRPLDLLKAFALLCESNPASLVFVGNGPLRHEMEQYVNHQRLQNVYFMGFRNQLEISKFYAMADLLVLSSCSETWGLVLNEAMCFGLPLVVSDRVGSAADLVRDGINGFTYPAGDVIALTDCLRRILKDDNSRHAMGLQSRAIIGNWGAAECFQGVLKCIETVVR